MLSTVLLSTAGLSTIGRFGLKGKLSVWKTLHCCYSSLDQTNHKFYETVSL